MRWLPIQNLTHVECENCDWRTPDNTDNRTGQYFEVAREHAKATGHRVAVVSLARTTLDPEANL